jgi:hypothetical protein
MFCHSVFSFPSTQRNARKIEAKSRVSRTRGCRHVRMRFLIASLPLIFTTHLHHSYHTSLPPIFTANHTSLPLIFTTQGREHQNPKP